MSKNNALAIPKHLRKYQDVNLYHTKEIICEIGYFLIPFFGSNEKWVIRRVYGFVRDRFYYYLCLIMMYNIVD